MDKNSVVVVFAASVISAVAGFGAGYLVANRIAAKREEEIEETLDGEELYEPFEPVERLPETPTDYAKFAKIKKSLEEIAKERGIEPEKRDDKPHIITYREARNLTGDGECELVSISYFALDSVFFNDDLEDKVTVPEVLFGPNIQNHFGEGNEDPDIVYVYYPQANVVYEISRIDEEYRVRILGEEPKRKPVRRRKVTKKVEEFADDAEE